jgi:hypothetical protein
MSDPAEKLSACIYRHCKISKKSVALARRLRALAESVRSGGKTPVPKQIAEMRSLVAEMKKHRVTADQIRCTAANCSKEYAKNAETVLHKAAEHMGKVVDMAERMMKDMQRRKESAAKAAKTAKAKSPKTAKAKSPKSPKAAKARSPKAAKAAKAATTKSTRPKTTKATNARK